MIKRILLVSIIFTISILSYAAPKKSVGTIKKALYGKLQDGRKVYQYTLKNKSGTTVKVINYGATVTSIIVRDKKGKFEDVVLGYDSLRGYVNDRSFLGVIVGRYGNRIAKGRFKLLGKDYQLTVNDGANHLHGGKSGFYKALWNSKINTKSANPSVILSYKSPDGEEGYPGNVDITVTYTLTKNNELHIDYKGTTDKVTILNPTNHCYFNLSGSFTNTILDHLLTIQSGYITPVDSVLITTGAYTDVTDTPMDFRVPTAIGAHINDSYEQLRFGKGYDHNWVLNNFNGKVREVAELYEPKSGRLMTVLTDQPGLQFYSGNFLNGMIKGKKGIAYQYRTGLCLEAQCYPDSPNKENFPNVILKPGETYHQTTIYKFSVK